MDQRFRRPTLVVSAREITILVVALAIFTLAAFVFVIGVIRLDGHGASEIPVATEVGGEGSQLTVPTLTIGPPATLALPPGPTPEPTASYFEHLVQANETLTSIAAFYGIGVQDLLSANGLTLNSVIRDGQSIIIPLPPSQAGRWHVVQPGEALASIAATYGISPEMIQTTNNLADANAIYAGQRLRIPRVPPEGATPEPTLANGASPAVPGTSGRIYASNWPRSILEGDLDANYPLTYTTSRFTIHYQPDTYVDKHLEETVRLAEYALTNVEARLDVQLEGTFDIYLAGTLFAAPNAHLHGLSRSADRRVFILHDGSGTETDNLYFFMHEITHLVSWNTWGAPSSVLLSEGVATYTGQLVLEDGGYLPYDELCTGIYAAGLMPSMTALEQDWQAFLGHIRNPLNYFSSACFVDYLIDTYGLDAMSRLYHTSDYEDIYGASLDSLDTDWREMLDQNSGSLTLSPEDLTAYTEEVGRTYDFILNNFNGTAILYEAYAAVDQARIALWKGNYPEARRWLDTVYQVIGYKP